ncbi:hypothetical protein BWI17_00750 [Betaproteobacteria bacterium GR16-43]|nr:hypothetical protein BWI17_00750 [Betaproteobacteria bacterium GR16-43]
MGFFRRILGRDPTADWPPADGKVPPFDPERGTFGAVRFDDALEKLRALGRPDDLDGDVQAKCDLHYHAGGFVAECEGGKFIGVRFHFEASRENKKVLTASATVGGMRLTLATKPDDVRAWFGEPLATDASEHGTELDYQRGKIFVMFDFDETGRLVYFNAYLDDQ